MFNPFAPFDPHFLNAFRQKGVKAFVKQTYERGRDSYSIHPQPAFLLIHFTDLANAQKHFDVISNDHNRQIYNVEDPIHWHDLVSMLNRPAGQRFYTNLTIRNVNQKAKQLLDRRIRDYIRNRTNWKPGRSEQVNFSLDFVFGEIYVELAYGAKKLKIKLEEIENQPVHA